MPIDTTLLISPTLYASSLVCSKTTQSISALRHNIVMTCMYTVSGKKKRP